MKLSKFYLPILIGLSALYPTKSYSQSISILKSEFKNILYTEAYCPTVTFISNQVIKVTNNENYEREHTYDLRDIVFKESIVSYRGAKYYELTPTCKNNSKCIKQVYDYNKKNKTSERPDISMISASSTFPFMFASKEKKDKFLNIYRRIINN